MSSDDQGNAEIWTAINELHARIGQNSKDVWALVREHERRLDDLAGRVGWQLESDDNTNHTSHESAGYVAVPDRAITCEADPDISRRWSAIPHDVLVKLQDAQCKLAKSDQQLHDTECALTDANKQLDEIRDLVAHAIANYWNPSGHPESVGPDSARPAPELVITVVRMLRESRDRIRELESESVVDPFKVRPTTRELDPDPALAQSNRLFVEQLDEIQRMANAAIAKYYNLAASHMHANQSPVRGVETVVKLLGQESVVCISRRDRIRELETENRQLRARIAEIRPPDPAQTTNIMDQAVAEILLAMPGVVQVLRARKEPAKDPG